MKNLLLPFGTLVLFACSPAQSGDIDRNAQYVATADEVTYCGTHFTIAIPKSDRFVIDPLTPEDMVLYHWVHGDTRTTFYVGNHPQKADMTIEVVSDDWPEVIAVHGSPERARTLRLSGIETPTGCQPAQVLKGTQ